MEFSGCVCDCVYGIRDFFDVIIKSVFSIRNDFKNDVFIFVRLVDDF